MYPKTNYALSNCTETSLDYCTFEHVTVLSNVICTSRQTSFKILRTNSCKIGMNCTSNKLYHVNKLIGLKALSLKFVHLKKLMKYSFWNMERHKTFYVSVYLSGRLRFRVMVQDILECTFIESHNLCNPGVMECSSLCY